MGAARVIEEWKKAYVVVLRRAHILERSAVAHVGESVDDLGADSAYGRVPRHARGGEAASR